MALDLLQPPPTSLEISKPSGPIIEDGNGTQKVIVFQNTLTPITCKSSGSRPEANVSWTLGTADSSVNSTSSVTPNPDDASLYDTEDTLQIFPERRHHNQTFRCLESFRTSRRYVKVLLLVYGPPNPPELNGTHALQAGVPAKVTCTSNNGYPAPLVHWLLGSKNVTKESTLEVTAQPGGRIGATSNLSFTPAQDDHDKAIVCVIIQPALHPTWSRNVTETLYISYSPVIIQSHIRRHITSNGSVVATFTCVSRARPPAYIFQWVYNETSLDNGTRYLIVHSSAQDDETVTSSMLIISDVQEIDNGNYECLANTDYGEGIAVINFTYSHPDPPFGFEVNQSQTTSSSLFVAWQPGFDGGSLQTFTLKYCTHDNAVKDQDCGIVSHLNTTNHQLRGLNSSTWYRLVLWAINDAGSSSTQETVASTAQHIPLETTNMAGSFIVTVGIGLLAGACFIMIPLIVAVRVFGVSCCLKKNKDEPETETPGQPIRTQREDDDELVYIDVSHENTRPPQPIRPARTEETHTVYASLDHDATSRRKEEQSIATTTTATVESQQVDDDGLVYIAISHGTSNPRKTAPIPSSGGTVYASINFNAMDRLKETDDSPTTSTMT
eukprot:XP_011670978.1 PREDICTED: neuronal cell adhesion molecule-like [Strongylocentrotus purpuratus]